MNAALVSLHDPFDFSFGSEVRESNYKRSNTLSYEDLARTVTGAPEELQVDACLLTLEMDRGNQEKVIIIT